MNTFEYFEGHSSSELTADLYETPEAHHKNPQKFTPKPNRSPLILRNSHALDINSTSHSCPNPKDHKFSTQTLKCCDFDSRVTIKLWFYRPNWNEGNGGESSRSHRFLPLRWAAMIVLPLRDDSNTDGETPSMTLGSSATVHFLILLPTQLSWIARRAASTSGSSGIFSFSSRRRREEGIWELRI